MWTSQIDADGHYSLFITPLHYYQTYIGCVISVLANSALVYIILSRPHQKMGNYKYVVLAFVCFDISYSLVDVITKPTYDFLEDTIQENFNISARNLGFISSVYWISNNNTIQMSYRDFFGMINIFILECGTFSAMIYCGYRSQRALSKFDTVLSPSTQARQKSLLKALVIQTMVPLFLAYIPCWVGFSLPLTPFEVSKVTSNNVVITAVTLFPICDCIVIIYYVKAFRDTLIEILGNIPYLNCWVVKIQPDSRSTKNNKVHNNSQSNNKRCSTLATC